MQAHFERFLGNLGAIFDPKIAAAGACSAVFGQLMCNFLHQNRCCWRMFGDFFVNFGAIFGSKIGVAGARWAIFFVNFGGLFLPKITVAGACLAVFCQFWGNDWPQNRCCGRMLNDFLQILEKCLVPKSLLPAHVGRFLVNFGNCFFPKAAVATACWATFYLILEHFFTRK